MKKIYIIAICMFLLISENKSQTIGTKCLHYPYNTQIGLNLNLNLLSKMRITAKYSAEGSNYFYSYPSLGADLGIYLYQRVYQWFGIQIGIEYSATTYAYNRKNFPGDQSVMMDYYEFGAWTFPILFNVSYYFNGKHGMDISWGGAPLILLLGDAGTGHGWSGDSEPGESWGDDGPKNYLKFRLDNETPFNFSLYAKIGYNYLLKNKNTLGIALIGSYSAKPYSQGNYYVRIDGVEVENGYTSLRSTFIGLQFSYGFTMKKLLCK